MENYEFFKREFEFRGKHARMAEELWILNDYEHTYFKRLIDLYLLAAVVGFRMNRKAEPDLSPFTPKSIFPEQMLKEKANLDFIMQMMLMLDDTESITDEERVKKAFRGASTKEEFDQMQEMFNSYVRGGVEELYERLIVRTPDADDDYYDEKTANIMELFARFACQN